jgi:hypothetical protein
MIDPHFEGRSGFATTVGGPDPWRPEDDSGRSPPQSARESGLRHVFASSPSRPLSLHRGGVDEISRESPTPPAPARG